MLRATLLKRPESLKKLAEIQIRDGIIRGRYGLGEPLQEAKLSAEFDISRTPIREALSALQLQGLVQIFPQRGAFVFALTRQEIEQLCGYRVLLEFNAIDLALQRDREGFLHELQRILSAMSSARSSNDFEQYLDLDADFHETFFARCGNTYLRDGYQKVGDIVRVMRTHLSRDPRRTDISFSEHEEIVALLGGRQVALAKEVLKKHITRGERAYTDLTNT